MIDAYINLDNSHKGFNSQLKDVELNKVEIKNIINENQINLVITSLSKYGETKKNLSNFESSNNLYPTLIIVDDKDFEQAIDFIKNPHIELISSKSKLEELRARIHALVGDAKSEILEFKDLTINLKTYEATAGKQLLDLTFMEYELLRFFVENQNNVWSREQLLSEVWGYDYFGGARTVDVHVRRLRAKLGDSRKDWVKTVHSVGYKFN
ncbi:MAG: response regulator transcription factor [Actinomycetota bacterium]|nr:response regulator transcription factor [Actinomycetota bacterium]